VYFAQKEYYFFLLYNHNTSLFLRCEAVKCVRQHNTMLMLLLLFSKRSAIIQKKNREYLCKQAMSKTGGGNSAQAGKWEPKELRASPGCKKHSAVTTAPKKDMEKADQAERRSCLAER
jgi:hypothetical protein